jgi:hypothetical protein
MGQGQPAPPNRRVKIGIDAGWVSEQAFWHGDQSLRASIQRQYPAPKTGLNPSWQGNGWERSPRSSFLEALQPY